MIPTRTSRPFGRTSPRVSDTDLARLIDATIKMRVDAKRDLGFAATNIGCDGRKRTTMFDGSVCQAEGEVCIAERQDGISACINAPTQGNGLTMFSVTFSAPVCEPVTGWWVLDDSGNLYRVPTDLQTVRDVYPVEVFGAEAYDMIRAGTWGDLRCAAALTPPTDNDDGSVTWISVALGESIIGYAQQFTANVGGALTWITILPTFTPGTDKVTVGAVQAYWSNVLYETTTDTDVALDQTDVNGITLIAGQEYKALIYVKPDTGTTAEVAAQKGNRASAGNSVLPANPFPDSAIVLGYATVSYGGGITAAVTATLGPLNWTGLRALGHAAWSRGIVHRDYIDPNAGARYLDITIPASESGVVSGTARVGYGYPLSFEFTVEDIGTGAPYGVATEADALLRADHDMALVYSHRLGIEYAPGHVNLDGGAVEPGDQVSLHSTDSQGISDVRANLVQFPGGDIGLQWAPGADFQRFRVRPAPTTPLAANLEQITPTTPWPDLGNLRTQPTAIDLLPWLEFDTTFTRTSGSWSHTRNVPCVLWHYKSGEADTYGEDPTAKEGVLGEPSGAACPISFVGGGGAQAPKGVGYTPRVTILGETPLHSVTYGWTFTANGIESALSPLSQPTSDSPLGDTYSRKLTVPTGPTGTTERAVYRFEVEIGEGPPNQWGSNDGYMGAVYDRMLKPLLVIDDNVTTEVFDEELTVALTGDPPPSPFLTIGAGVTFDCPATAYALAPLNLTA